MESAGSKYPKTLVSAGRQDLVFTINNGMTPLEKKDFEKIPPMTTFKSWSSIGLEFANSKDRVGGSGNIEVNRIADVVKRTNIVMQYIMEAEAEGKEKTSSSDLGVKIFYVPIEMKEDKGATAMQLAEKYDAGIVKKAVDTLRDLAKKGGGYAKANERQADALQCAMTIVNARRRMITNPKTGSPVSIAELFATDEAYAIETGRRLHKEGHPDAGLMVAVFRMISEDPSKKALLLSTGSVKDKKFIIYAPVLKTPRISKVDAEGYTKAYELSVTCIPTHLPYPFHVELTTMRGKPMQGRQVGVEPGSIIDRKTFAIDLQTWEWVNMVDKMELEKNLITLFHHKEAYQAMVRMDDANRAASRVVSA